MGLLLAVVVHPANIQDRDGARLVIDKLIGRFPRLRLIWADAGYGGQLVDWVMSMSGWVLEIVKRPRASHQFEVLPRRWVVERTLAWLGRCRRLSKDYEALTGTTEAWLHIGIRCDSSHAPTLSSVMMYFENTLLALSYVTSCHTWTLIWEQFDPRFSRWTFRAENWSRQ